MSIETQQQVALEVLVQDLLREKKSDRLWKNIRFFLIFFLVCAVFFGLFMRSNNASINGDAKNGYVSLIYLDGMIGPGQDFSARNVIPLLEQAFADNNSKGVVLDINSGGGTPVQAAIIHDAIVRLKNKYHKKIVVVGEDMLASGAYYVAVSADKIFVNANGLTGSIGVIMKDFGFTDLIKKIGVERRVYTAGANKDRLDPFLPQTQADIEKIRQVIDEVHHNFEVAVQQGRQGKLHDTPDVIFSGDFWSGNSAVKLGLVDGVGDLSDVLRNEFNVSAYKDYSQQPSVIKNLLGQIGMSFDLMFNQKNDTKLLTRL